MARLVKIKSGEVGNVDDKDLYKYLDSGLYDFADKTAVHVVDKENPSGLGKANLMSPADAKRYIIKGAGSYMNEERISAYKDRRKKERYADREGTAAALGAAGALTFGVAPAVAGLFSDEASGIMEANPNWMLGSDIMTTIAALALSPATGGATAAAGSPALLRLLSKTPMGKAGARSLIDNAAKYTKYMAPHLADKFGKSFQTSIGKRLLGEAAEEQLKKAGARGLVARMGGMGAEALVYSAGYSLHDVVNDYKKEREWEDIGLSYLHNVGLGTAIGVAIPGVFMGTPMVAGKLLSAGKQITEASLGTMPVSWAMNSKTMKDAVKSIAKGHENMYVESMWGPKKDQLDYAATAESIIRRQGATKAAKEYAKRITPLTSKTADYAKTIVDNRPKIKGFSQLPHKKTLVDRKLMEVRKTEFGIVTTKRASSPLLAERLLNGNSLVATEMYGALKKDEVISEGFLQVLKGRTLGLMADNQKRVLRPSGYKQFQVEAEKELNGILFDINSIKNLTNSYVSKLANTEVITNQGRSRIANLVGEAVSDNRTIQQDYIARYMREASGNRVLSGRLQVDFNSAVFTALEKLSARIHKSTTRGGPVSETVESQKWAKIMKDHLDNFLTEKGNVWEKGASGNMFSMFGEMSSHKLRLSDLLNIRNTQHDEIISRFGTKLEERPDILRMDKGKIESILRSQNYTEADSTWKFLEEYASTNEKIFKHFDHSIDFDQYGGLAREIKDLVSRLNQSSKDIKNEIIENNKFIEDEMRPALRFSAVLDAEAKQAMATPDRGLLPYLGTGALASGAGYMVAGPVGAGVAGAASLAGRYAYDAMANPAKSLAQMHKFFAATDAFDEFIDSQVERYFKWVNTASERSGRLAYDGPGSDNSGRYSSILGSRFIAEYVSGGDN